MCVKVNVVDDVSSNVSEKWLGVSADCANTFRLTLNTKMRNNNIMKDQFIDVFRFIANSYDDGSEILYIFGLCQNKKAPYKLMNDTQNTRIWQMFNVFALSKIILRHKSCTDRALVYIVCQGCMIVII